MTQSSPSAAAVAAKIRSMANKNGAYSIAGRLRSESVEAIAQRLAPNFARDFTEANVIAALGRLAARLPEHFRSMKETVENLRESRVEKQQPRGPVSGMNRKKLAQLSAEEKLNFANTGDLPKNFTKEDSAHQ